MPARTFGIYNLVREKKLGGIKQWQKYHVQSYVLTILYLKSYLANKVFSVQTRYLNTVKESAMIFENVEPRFQCSTWELGWQVSLSAKSHVVTRSQNNKTLKENLTAIWMFSAKKTENWYRNYHTMTSAGTAEGTCFRYSSCKMFYEVPPGIKCAQ